MIRWLPCIESVTDHVMYSCSLAMETEAQVKGQKGQKGTKGEPGVVAAGSKGQSAFLFFLYRLINMRNSFIRHKHFYAMAFYM